MTHQLWVAPACPGPQAPLSRDDHGDDRDDHFGDDNGQSQH